METLNIAFVTDKSAPIYFGGYEIRVLELANRLAEKGHDVHVYTTSPKDFVTPEGAAFHASFPQTFQNGISGRRSLMHSTLFSLALARNPMGSWKPDFLVVESIPYLHLLFMRRWVRQLQSINVLDVPEAWSNYSYLRNGFGNPSGHIISRLLSMGIDFSDVVVAISRITADSLARNYNVDDNRLSVIPCGVNISHLRRVARENRDEPSRAKEYDFVTVGRLVGIKRHGDFIDALGMLKKNLGWNGKAAVVGSGPLEEELRARAIRNDVYQNIDFMGFVGDEEKIRILASSKVFVLSSEREGFSIATLEAMAVGLPVIVARPAEIEVFGPSEFVVHGKNGLFYPVGDRGALAGAMERLLSSGSDLTSFGSHGRLTATFYDWESVVNGFEWKLRNFVASRRAKSQP